jgi:phosphoribosylformimino-5-aminoimidazole carboxamide ribotide isomerase
MTTPEEFLKANGFVSASEIDSQSLIGAFISEMEKGLAGEESSLRMIPAYVGVNGRIPQGAKAAVLDAGAARAIIGSAALDDPEFLSKSVEIYGDRIAVGIDARDGFVQTKGWVETSKTPAVELARAVAAMGVKTIIYTDTATDGMLGGPNLVQMAAICDAAPTCDITASGGVSSPQDVKNLIALGKPNLRAAIVGKALYDGRVTLAEMNAAAQAV